MDNLPKSESIPPNTENTEDKELNHETLPEVEKSGEKIISEIEEEATQNLTAFESDQAISISKTEETAKRLGFSGEEVSFRIDSTALSGIGERASRAYKRLKKFLVPVHNLPIPLNITKSHTLHSIMMV